MNSCDGDADAPVALAHFAAKNRSRVENERQHGEGDQRQPPVHVQHDDQDAQQHEDVFEDGDHARGEHLVQRIHVAGDAGHQPPHRVAVEEGNMQALQVAEYLRPQIEHHLLSRPLHDVGLGKFEQEAEQQQADVNACDLGDAGHRPGAEKAVQQGVGFGVAGKIFIDRDLGEIGAEHVGARFQHDGDQGNDDLHPIGAQIGQQTFHQPAVICFA